MQPLAIAVINAIATMLNELAANIVVIVVVGII